MNKKRGIVYCPHFEENNGDIYIPHVQIQNSEMQIFCLYWDYIIQPVSSQLPHWKAPTNEKVLESAGILIKDFQEPPTNTPRLEVERSAYSIKSEGTHQWANKFREFQFNSLHLNPPKPND